MTFFEPNPALLLFFAIKQVWWMPFIAVLSLIRVFAARGAARWLALVALLIAGAGIAVQIVPGLTGLYDHPALVLGSQWRNAWGGMISIACASLPLLYSSYAPGRRWPWIDVVHILSLIALVGLWGYTLYG